jgi:hypothetical protein
MLTVLTVLTQKPPFRTGNLRLLTLAAPSTTVMSYAKVFQAAVWLVCGPMSCGG